MTNEEKVKEIANLCKHCIESDGQPCDGCMECELRVHITERKKWQNGKMHNLMKN